MSTTKKVKVYHLFVLDKSGSMQIVVNETIAGVNQQLETLREITKENPEQEQCVSIVQFGSCGDIVETFWCENIENIDNINSETYQPGGMTALFDAVGGKTTKLKAEIAKELEDKKASVILTIFTDGEENDSKEFVQGDMLSKLLKDVQDTGRWTVAFVGCGDDVFDVARRMNISTSNTLSYAKGKAGTQHAFRSMSLASANYVNAVADGAPEAALQSDYFCDTDDNSGSGDDQPDSTTSDKSDNS